MNNKYRITYEDSCEFKYTVWRSYKNINDAYEAFKDSGYKIVSIEEVL